MDDMQTKKARKNDRGDLPGDTPGLERIGPYELLLPIGAGGSGRVFRGRAPDGRDVAVKIWTGGADDAVAVKRFRREAEIIGQVSHPNLIGLVDFGVVEGMGPYLVTPFVDGVTMRRFAALHPMTPEAVMAVLIPLLSGLSALHHAGCVHRDLKPENVMVTADGALKIMDLGLVYTQTQSHLTKDRQVVGSVPYMAPEQIEGGSIRPAVDIWAVGVMAYEWLSGRRPFQRSRESEEVAAILSGSHTPIEQADRRVGAELKELVEDCLKTEPSERPIDAGALLQRVRRACVVEQDPDIALAELTADPPGFMERRTALMRERLLRETEKRLASDDPFGAFQALDRAMAYCPGDEELVGWVERVSAQMVASRSQPRASAESALMEASVESEVMEAGGPGRFRIRRIIIAAAVGLVGLSVLVVLGLWITGKQGRSRDIKSKPPVAAAGIEKKHAPPGGSKEKSNRTGANGADAGLQGTGLKGEGGVAGQRTSARWRGPERARITRARKAGAGPRPSETAGKEARSEKRSEKWVKASPDVMSLFKRKIGSLEGCYQAARKKHPEVKALPLRIDLKVMRTGKVLTVRLSPSYPKLSGFIPCIRRRLLGIRFPPHRHKYVIGMSIRFTP